MTKIIQIDYDKLARDMHGIFHMVFRNMGVAFSPQQSENLRDTCNKLVKQLMVGADVVSNSHVKTLEEYMRKAFIAVAKDMSELEERISKLESNPSNIKLE